MRLLDVFMLSVQPQGIQITRVLYLMTCLNGISWNIIASSVETPLLEVLRMCWTPCDIGRPVVAMECLRQLLLKF